MDYNDIAYQDLLKNNEYSIIGTQIPHCYNEEAQIRTNSNGETNDTLKQVQGSSSNVTMSEIYSTYYPQQMQDNMDMMGTNISFTQMLLGVEHQSYSQECIRNISMASATTKSTPETYYQKQLAGQGIEQQWQHSVVEQQWQQTRNEQQWHQTGNEQQWKHSANEKQLQYLGKEQQWKHSANEKQLQYSGKEQQWQLTGNEQQWQLSGNEGTSHVLDNEHQLQEDLQSDEDTPPKKYFRGTRSTEPQDDDEMSESENCVPDKPSEAGGHENVPEDEEEQEFTEDLDEEDIRIFIENDSIKAAQSCSQEAQSHHVPTVHMIFDTDAEAYRFYHTYSLICGFSITKATLYNSRSNEDKITTRRTFKCNRGGKPVDEEELERRKKQKQLSHQKRTGKPPPTTTRRRNPIKQTGCTAQMVIYLENGKWVVRTVNLEHNHELSPQDETKFLRAHKHMTPHEQMFIRTFTSVKMPTRKIMSILTYLRGGKPRNVPYDKKYVSNVRTRIRNENKDNDMTQVLSYFRARQDEDPMFYYNFKLGPGNKVECIFWSDSYSRRMYDLYGDCLSFDTTYRTNRYNLPFAPFVGITGHGQNCLFACAIINNEQGETFEWLFKEFMKCMGGKAPVTIITDQCSAMGTTIPDVFPNTIHRNCFWHITSKAEEKCGRSFSRIPFFHADFNDILRNSLTVAEFESLWQEMIIKYNVGHLKYLNIMWENRHRYAPVYFKTAFFPFIHSTARSEGTNAIFKDNICSTYSVISFLGEYQTISENIEEKERKQDSVTRITEPDYHLRTELEYQAARMYNRKIFYRFQKQIILSTKLHVDEVERHVRYEVYKSNMLAVREIRPRRYVVLVNMQEQNYICICGKFQKDGIVCAHVLRVLGQLNISELPEKYYIDRWKPKERKDVRHKETSVPIDLTTSNRHLRHNVLSRKMASIASEASYSNEKYMYLLDISKTIEEKLLEMTLEEEKVTDAQNKGKEPVQKRNGPHPDGFGDYLQNPDVVSSKGRPLSDKRRMSFYEELMTRNEITCSHCRSNEHNIAGCTFLHLPASMFENLKKKKKQTPKKTTGPKKQPGSSTKGTTDKQPSGVKKPRKKAPTKNQQEE